MAQVLGNLPPSSNTNKTTEYFNNYFENPLLTSPNINDATVAYFQSLTGDADSGKLLAATVINTALANGLDPMNLIDQFRSLSTGKTIEVKTPIAQSSVYVGYKRLQDIQLHKDEWSVGQLFYVPPTDGWYKIVLADNNSKQVEPAIGYKAELRDTSVQIADPANPGQTTTYVYNFFIVTYNQEKDELTPYITMLLNSNRVSTSLLGLGNSPQPNKYIQRAILP